MSAHPDVIYVQTADDWQLALHVWRARGAKYARPILMVHGLAANRLNLDLDENLSIARAAQRSGFDVYLLDLRGAGLSRPPGGKDRRAFQWSFTDYALHDVPSAVHAVLTHSGATQLHGFGHSMGGMLLYAFGVSQPPELSSIVSVGAPLTGELRLAPRERRLLGLVSRLNPQRSSSVPLRRIFSAGGRFIKLAGRLVDGALLNADNVDQELMARLARESIDDAPRQLLSEFYDAIGREELVSGPFSFESKLGNITTPVFALSGSVDRIAPPASVSAAARRLGSAEVDYREIGLNHGDQADYGHIDLLVGRHAPTDVYAPIIEFWEDLEERLGSPPTPQAPPKRH